MIWSLDKNEDTNGLYSLPSTTLKHALKDQGKKYQNINNSSYF